MKDYYGYKVSRDGVIIGKTGKILPQHKRNGKYPQVQMYIEKGTRTMMVAQVVAECYVPNPDNLPYLIHIDGDSANNHADNLKWSDRICPTYICKYSRGGTLIAQYETLTEACLREHLSPSTISNYYRGVTNDPEGYIWKRERHAEYV